MTGLTQDELAGRRPELQKVAALLGGARVLGRSLKDPLDAHEVLLAASREGHSSHRRSRASCACR